MKRDSHFFLLRPSPQAIGELAEIRDAFSHGAPVKDGLLHVTLAWFGYDRGDLTLLPRAMVAAEALRAAPFRLVFDQLVGAERSLLLVPSEPLGALEEFQRRLVTALAGQHLAPHRRWRFHPHVNLRRGRFADAGGPILPVAWTADTLLLVRSEIGHGRHVELGRWLLRR